MEPSNRINRNLLVAKQIAAATERYVVTLRSGNFMVRVHVKHLTFTFLVRGENHIEFSMLVPGAHSVIGPLVDTTERALPKEAYILDAQTALEIAEAVHKIDD